MLVKSGLIDNLLIAIGRTKIQMQAGGLSGRNSRSGELDTDIGIDICRSPRHKKSNPFIRITVTDDQVTIWDMRTGKVIFTDFPEGYADYLSDHLKENKE